TDSKGKRRAVANVKGFTSYRMLLAISHVWSDGLGNPHRNSLPQCQMIALYDLLANHAFDRAFDLWRGGIKATFEFSAMAKAEGEGDMAAASMLRKMESMLLKVGSGVETVVRGYRRIRGQPLSLWMDTLCIPHDKKLKRMAIAGLKKVYSG